MVIEIKKRMSKENSKKGYIYTLEVLLAISMIFVTMTSIFRSAPPATGAALSLMKQQGANALAYMDAKGALRNITFNGNEIALKNNLTPLLSGVGFDAVICEDNCTAIRGMPEKDIVSVSYYVSGYANAYKRKKVILWLWEKA